MGSEPADPDGRSGMRRSQPKENGPQDAATSQGPNAKAVEAIASHVPYTKGKLGRKAKVGRRSAALPNWRNSDAGLSLVATFEASDGRTWRYTGKRARVLVMLVQEGHSGLTQWDTYPWHTRLGGTIHAMRQDGLAISTELEGDWRHARYRLCTEGRLLIQAKAGGEAVLIHRVAA